MAAQNRKVVTATSTSSSISTPIPFDGVPGLVILRIAYLGTTTPIASAPSLSGITFSRVDAVNLPSSGGRLEVWAGWHNGQLYTTQSAVVSLPAGATPSAMLTTLTTGVAQTPSIDAHATGSGTSSSAHAAVVTASADETVATAILSAPGAATVPAGFSLDSAAVVLPSTSVDLEGALASAVAPFAGTSVDPAWTTAGGDWAVVTLALVASGVLPDAAAAPTYGTVTPSTVQVNIPALTTNATSCNLMRAPDVAGSPGAFSLVTGGGGITPSAVFTDTGLASNTTYWYRVDEVDAAGSTPGASSSVSTPVAPPASPGHITFGAPTSASVPMTLPPLPTGAVTLTVQRSPDNGSGTGPSGSWTTPTGGSGLASGASFTDATVAAATRYWYRAQAVNAGGSTNGPADFVSTPAAPPGVAAAPTLSNVQQTSIDVTAPGMPAGGAQMAIVRTQTGYPDVTITGSVAPGATIRDGGLTPNTTYGYHALVTGLGGSTAGLTASATTLTSSPDFALRANPASIVVSQGGSVDVQILVDSLGGESLPVALTLVSPPSGVTGTFLPSAPTPPSGGSAAATLTLTAVRTTATGPYSLQVQGDDGTHTHTVTIPLTVTGAAMNIQTATGAFALIGAGLEANEGQAVKPRKLLDRTNGSLDAMLNVIQRKSYRNQASAAGYVAGTGDVTGTLTVEPSTEGISVPLQALFGPPASTLLSGTGPTSFFEHVYKDGLAQSTMTVAEKEGSTTFLTAGVRVLSLGVTVNKTQTDPVTFEFECRGLYQILDMALAAIGLDGTVGYDSNGAVSPVNVTATFNNVLTTAAQAVTLRPTKTIEERQVLDGYRGPNSQFVGNSAHTGTATLYFGDETSLNRYFGLLDAASGARGASKSVIPLPLRVQMANNIDSNGNVAYIAVLYPAALYTRVGQPYRGPGAIMQDITVETQYDPTLGTGCVVYVHSYETPTALTTPDTIVVGVPANSWNAYTS